MFTPMSVGDLYGLVPEIFSRIAFEHRESFHVAVVVHGRLVVRLQMEGVDHVHIVQIGGGRLIGQVHGVAERQVPDGEGSNFA